MQKEIYEIGYLLIPSISEDDLLTEVANIKAILEKEGATFLSGDEPKFTNLAYPISKMFGADKQTFEKAYFAWMKFEVAVESIAKTKKELDKYENILRFLLIKSLAKDTLVSETKKVVKAPEVVLVDAEKEKKVEPLKIVDKKEEKIEEVIEDKKEEKIEEIKTEEEKEEVEVKEEVKEEKVEKEKTEALKEKTKTEDLDETIENLIIK